MSCTVFALPYALAWVVGTIITGAIIKIIVSIIFCAGNIGILNTSLNAGIAKITIISKLDNPIAPISFLFPPIPVLNKDSLLFLTLNT